MLCPAIVSVPVRAAPLFGNALKPTDPFPLPLAPDVMDSHAALLTAVHVQPDCVWTEIEGPAPPAAATDTVNGAVENEHDAEAWLTEIV